MKNLIDYRTDHNSVYDCICHVDILMYVDPQLDIHTAIKNLKGISTRTLRKELPWLKSRIPALWINFILLQLLMELVLKYKKLH